MLSLYSSLSSARSELRRIVKSGLQLFYKANGTQAPLGEEQLRNNSFDEITSNLVSNPTFDLGSEEVVNGDFANGTTGWVTNDWTISNNVAASGNTSTLLQQTNVFINSTGVYKSTFKARSVNGTNVTLRFYDGLNEFEAFTITSSDFQDFTLTRQRAGDNSTLYIYNVSSAEIEITNISVKEVPNWELGDGWSVGDGKASNDGESGSNNLNQDGILTSSKSYQITIEVSDYVSGNVQVSAGATPRGIMTANGTYTFTQATSGNNFYIIANSFVGSVDNVSVKQLDPNSSWTLGTGWVFSNNGTITHTGSVGNFESSRQLVTGKKYEATVVVDSIADNSCNLFNSSNSETYDNTITSAGTHVRQFTATHATSKIALRSASSNLVVSSFSVKEITNSIKDHSRNSNDGILYSGKALDFDGTDDLVELNDANLTGEFTVCTWIKPDTFTNCVVFGDGVDENDNYLNLNWIRLNSATSITVKIAGNSTGYAPITHGGNIAQDEWSRLIVTRGSDNIVRFGINGVLYSPSTTARAGTFDFNLLGRKQGTEMNGALADVQVYDKAWTASDVEFDYNNPDKDVFDNSNSSIVVTDCKSLLRLNEGAGDRVYDAAPVLGVEEVVDGDFPLPNVNWSFQNSAWSINNNKALYDGTEISYISQSGLTIIAGKTYQVSFDIEDSSGQSRIQISNQAAGEIYSPYTDRANGSYVVTFTSSTNQSTLAFKGHTSGTSFSLSNVSLKEIKPAESFSIIGNKTFLHQQPYIPQYAMSSFSKKMLFDGSNDYVACGSDASIDDIFTGGGTFSAWISVASDGGESIGTIMGKGTVSIRVKEDDNGGVMLNLAKGFSTTNADFLTSDEVVLENKINHIAITYNDSSASNTPSFYVNGVLKAIDTGNSITPVGSASTDASANLILGNALAGGTRSFDGIIDEVSLFDVELTQTEVLELYNSGSSFDSTGHSKYNLGEEVSNGTFELGSEEVVDGGIDSISNWSFGNGWSYVDGKASLVQVSTLDYLSQQLTGLVNGRTYVLSFDLDIISATTTTIGVSSTGAFGQLSSDDRFFTTSGRKTITEIYDSSHQSGTKYLRFVGGSNTEFTIDNVSVKEVPSWSNSTASSATMSVNTNGQLVLASDAGDNLGAYSSISLVQGRTYVLSVDIISCNVLGQIRIGTSASVGSTSPDDIFNAGGSGVPLGTNTYTFTATSAQASNGFLYIGGRDDVNSLVIDNVSLQEYGLSAYWRNNGAAQWDDLSTNTNHGTVSGSPAEIFLQEVSFFGKDSLGMFMNKPRLGGLNFAKNGWVEVRDNVSLDVASTNAISVCCWYRANSAASYDAAQYLVNSETYSNAGGWTLIAGTTQIIWTAEAGSNASIGYNHNDRLGWQYIVATYDEQNYRLFTFDENGDISVTTPVASTSALVDEYPINIGGFNEGSGSLINGVIDDIKIYNKALTQAEIKKNFNATKGRHKN